MRNLRKKKELELILDFENRKKVLEEQCRNISAEYENAKQTIERAKQERASLEADKRGKLYEIEQLKNDYQKEKQHLQIVITNLQNEKRKLSEEINKINEENERKRRFRKEEEQKILELQRKHQDLASYIEECHQVGIKKELENEQKAEEFKKLQKNVEKLKYKERLLHESINDMQDKLSALRNDLKDEKRALKLRERDVNILIARMKKYCKEKKIPVFITV